jgi:hypothetical protein
VSPTKIIPHIVHYNSITSYDTHLGSFTIQIKKTIIQTHPNATFIQETDELQKKQLWYKQKQSTITKEEEAEYVSYCADAMFRIHILEQRLNKLY